MNIYFHSHHLYSHICRWWLLHHSLLLILKEFLFFAYPVHFCFQFTFLTALVSLGPALYYKYYTCNSIKRSFDYVQTLYYTVSDQQPIPKGGCLIQVRDCALMLNISWVWDCSQATSSWILSLWLYCATINLYHYRGRIYRSSM